MQRLNSGFKMLIFVVLQNSLRRFVKRFTVLSIVYSIHLIHNSMTTSKFDAILSSQSSAVEAEF